MKLVGAQCVVLLIILLKSGQVLTLNNVLLRESSVNNQSLVQAVLGHIRKVFLKHYATINLTKALKPDMAHLTNDLISQILMECQEHVTILLDDFHGQENFKSRLKSQTIIFLDRLESFREFNKKLDPHVFEFRGKYLLVLVDGRQPGEVEEIFDSLWKKQIFNVNVLFQTQDNVKLMTFLPFQEGSKCRNNDVVEMEIPAEDTESFFPNKFKNLQKCVVKVLTFEDILAVYKVNKSDGTHELAGFDIELINIVSKSLNFNLEFKFFEGIGTWGTIYKNGSASGIIGELIKREGEIAISNYYLKQDRANVVDFSVSYHSSPSVFVVPPGAPFSPLQKLLQPFKSFVWMLIVSTFLTGLLVVVIVKKKPRKVQDFVFGEGVRSPATNMLIIILGGSQTRLPRHNFSRFIFMMFSLFCLVQRSLYQGSLYLFLQSDGLQRSIETVDEVYESKHKIIAYESAALAFESRPDLQMRCIN